MTSVAQMEQAVISHGSKNDSVRFALFLEVATAVCI